MVDLNHRYIKPIRHLRKHKYFVPGMAIFFIGTAVICSIGILVIMFSIYNVSQPSDTTVESVTQPKTTTVTPTFIEKTNNLNVKIDSTANIIMTSDMSLKDVTSLPKFTSVQGETITLSPTKDDVGTYSIEFYSSTVNSPYSITHITYTINVKLPDVGKAQLEQDVKNAIGDNINDFGVYLYDLKRNDIILSINADEVFKPASIIKVPTAVLLLRDVDSGKASLDDTFAIQDALKFSTIDSLGELDAGTDVTLREYLRAMISDSNNTAFYHLDAYLGGLNQVEYRAGSELGVSPYSEDPPETTAANVGKVFVDIYNAKTLSRSSSDYLINLMKNADESLRVGIGSGLPQEDDVTFANKIGFLDTDEDLAYQDSAIVWGKETNYVLVVLDRNIDWASATDKLQNISAVVYKALNN